MKKGNLAQLREVSEKVELALIELENIFLSESLLIVQASETGYFTKVSIGWEREFGYTSEEFCSKPWVFYVHPNDVEKTIEIAKKMSAGVPVKSFTNRYRKRNGEYVTLLWGGNAFENGRSFVTAIVLP